MDFGIDTFDTHLDLIPDLDWDFFRQLNGGTIGPGRFIGGDPVFAGRNFLGGDFIWGHAEATDALAHPSPEDLGKLKLIVPRIAPIQAPQPDRQKMTDERGSLYGQIDATAICTRLFRSIWAREFKVPQSGIVNIWLAIDPDAELSLEYWIGWSDVVNKFSASQNLGVMQPGSAAAPDSPFLASILCRYTKDPATGKLKRDPHVTATLEKIAFMQSTAFLFRWADARCNALWADTTLKISTTPSVDWNLFDVTETPQPSLWRFQPEFKMDDGTQVDVEYTVDAVQEPQIPGSPKVTDYMLLPQKWQPNVPDVINLGFITDQGNGITDRQVKDIETNIFPNLQDLGHHYNIPGRIATVIGRYLKPNVRRPGETFVLSRAEAEKLSKANFQIFTIWEDVNVLARKQAIDITYFDPAIHAGTEDGRAAFEYVGAVLHQPSHTPVFFTVDFDAPDPSDPRVRPVRDAKERILHYFELVKSERDAYAQAHPDHYYLIGVYANGGVNRWCYEQGIVSIFWQSNSPGGSGNRLPERPWYHANRWQYSKETELEGAGWRFVRGADPDLDWGDGGTWNLMDPLEQRLLELDQRQKIDAFQKLYPYWANLIDPPRGIA